MVLSLTAVHQHNTIYTFTHWDMFGFKQEQLPSEDNIYMYVAMGRGARRGHGLRGSWERMKMERIFFAPLYG